MSQVAQRHVEDCRHLSPREPRGYRFSWARLQVPKDQGRGVTYRLFRRSIERRVFMEARTFRGFVSRSVIAVELLAMRRRLLEAVDAVDFKALGL